MATCKFSFGFGILSDERRRYRKKNLIRIIPLLFLDFKWLRLIGENKNQVYRP
jgi:hypothetical protein